MNKLLELLFPPKCMLCGQLLGEEEEICGQCRKKILLNTAPPRTEKGAFLTRLPPDCGMKLTCAGRCKA